MGQTRDKVAKQLGMSGKQLEKLETIEREKSSRKIDLLPNLAKSYTPINTRKEVSRFLGMSGNKNGHQGSNLTEIKT